MLGRSIFPWDHTAQARKATGKHIDHGNRLGMGNLKFYGNDWDGIGLFVHWLGGTRGTIFSRERELTQISEKSCRNIAAGIFRRTALENTKSGSRYSKFRVRCTVSQVMDASCRAGFTGLTTPNIPDEG